MDVFGDTHRGYLDGLYGKDPDPELSRLRSYETGWLHGAEDREKGVEDNFSKVPKHLGCGSLVKIPKGCPVETTSHGTRLAGRTYQVRIHDVHRMRPAYIDFDGRFRRPEPSRVLWAGTGGYWSTASVNDVVFIRD